MRSSLIILLLLPWLLTPLTAEAQDIHFTQFEASPLTLNPAHTGHFDGDWRLMNIHRRQWAAIGVPFLTTGVGYDRPFYLYNERASGGVIFINDRSGDARLTVNKIYLSGAIHKKIAFHEFHWGLQVGYVNKSFSLDNFTFPSQYDRNIGQFNNQVNSQESGINNQLSYLDLNTGIIWSKAFKGFRPEVGLALFHFNRPNESFTGAENRLPSRQVVHVGGQIDLTDKYYFSPLFLYMAHSRATNMLTGGHLGMKWQGNPAIRGIYAGSLFRDGFRRNTDAYALIFGIQFRQVRVGASYDVNISELKTATNNQGGWEFSLIYTAPSTVLKKNAIPCDRY